MNQWLKEFSKKNCNKLNSLPVNETRPKTPAKIGPRIGIIAACLSVKIGLSLGPLQVCLETWDSLESYYPNKTFTNDSCITLPLNLNL